MLIKLQNGNDVRGVSVEGYNGEAVNFTADDACKIARAYARHLAEKIAAGKSFNTSKTEASDDASAISATGLKISVGHDSRISADDIKEGVIRGLLAEGCEVLDSHLASTPAMFMSTLYDEFNCDGAIMITASHLPYNRNGMKFFCKEGSFEKADTGAVLAAAEDIPAVEKTAAAEAIPAMGKASSEEESAASAAEATSVEKTLTKIAAAAENTSEGGNDVADSAPGEGACAASKTECPENSVVTPNFENEISSADNLRVHEVDIIDVYSRDLREKIRAGVNSAGDYDHPLRGLHIIVDAGNGAGGFFESKVLAPLGADTSGSQFLEPDGMFPNHMPNPENTAAMESVRAAVLASKADLGIIFDTDVDRMSAVLSDGAEINRDGIIAMMAAILAPDYPKSTIVTDSVTSDRLRRFLEGSLGLKQHRFKRGYKNVINESKRLNEEGILSPLAIETSGHGAMKENYFLDDGAYMAVKLVISAAKAAAEGKKVDNLIADFEPGFEEREYRLKISGEDFADYGKDVLDVFKARAQASEIIVEDSFEGVRLKFDSEEIKGWLLLRMSLHDPLLPLNMEGEREGDCDKIVGVVKELLSGFDRLDLSVFG